MINDQPSQTWRHQLPKNMLGIIILAISSSHISNIFLLQKGNQNYPAIHRSTGIFKIIHVVDRLNILGWQAAIE